MMESSSYPLGGNMLKSMLIGFLLGFVLMGAVQGSIPAVAEMQVAAHR